MPVSHVQGLVEGHDGNLVHVVNAEGLEVLAGGSVTGFAGFAHGSGGLRLSVSHRCRSLSRGSDPNGAVCVDCAGGVPQFVDGCGIHAFHEAPIIIGVPSSCWQMAHIHSHAPIGNDVGQLDAIPNSPFPIGRVVMVQVDEPNPAVNLMQFLVGHVPSHVMLEEHHVEDEALGSWMPMKASILLGVFD